MVNHIGIKHQAMVVGLGLNDRTTGFVVRSLHIDSHAPLKPRTQAIGQSWDIFGPCITGDNNLFVGLVQGVEGMEEFFLSLFLASDELDVINDQDIGAAVSAGEVSI